MDKSSSSENRFIKLPKEATYIVGLTLGVILILFLILANKKTAGMEDSPPSATYVITESAKKISQQKNFTAFGEVLPAKMIKISPELPGKVSYINPKLSKGAFFKKGELLFKLESEDYEAIAQYQEALYLQSSLELKIEKGRQAVAQLEWEIMEKEFSSPVQSKNLALRKPQMKLMLAKEKAAKSNWDKAKRDLQKLQITAPYNGFILNQYFEEGQFLPKATPTIDFVNVDSFYIEASIASRHLDDLLEAQQGNKDYKVAINHSNNDSSHSAYFKHIIPALQNKSKLSKILLEVRQPLKGDSPKKDSLLLGSFVRLTFPGPLMKNIIKLPRKALRNSNDVWVKNEEDQLEIREVKILFQDLNSVYITEGLEEGEEYITSSIALPIEGILLETLNQGDADEPSI
ncbi:MAG: efflux RND transporter periplasmic adaptor subunit [Chlamydiales bacterium]|nr:efflux RND transporter periplasmic adaptor subunit [Chlamydiales bacterium]